MNNNFIYYAITICVPATNMSLKCHLYIIYVSHFMHMDETTM